MKTDHIKIVVEGMNNNNPVLVWPSNVGAGSVVLFDGSMHVAKGLWYSLEESNDKVIYTNGILEQEGDTINFIRVNDLECDINAEVVKATVDEHNQRLSLAPLLDRFEFMDIMKAIKPRKLPTI